VEVKGKGGVTVTEIDEVEDIVFFLEKTFDKGEGVLEGGGVEERGRHCEREVGLKKACWLDCECLDNCLKSHCKFFLLL